MTAADRKVYEAVKKRALVDEEYLACEQCKHNGQKWPLEMHHINFRSQGGLTSENNVTLICKCCHLKAHAIVV